MHDSLSLPWLYPIYADYREQRDPTRQPLIAAAGYQYQVPEDLLARLKEDNILVAREFLNFGDDDVLGEGQFGRVYKGLLRQPTKVDEIDVAAKTLNSSK